MSTWTDERGVTHRLPITVVVESWRVAQCGRCGGATFWSGPRYDHTAILAAWYKHRLTTCTGNEPE